MSISDDAFFTQLPHRVTLALDPMTHAELERAAGQHNVESYLYVLAGRYARWNELREWLAQLEAVYGTVPPEALERLHRQMLGLPRRSSSAECSLTLMFDAEEFNALRAEAGEWPLAYFVREIIAAYLTTREPESESEAVGSSAED